MMRIYLDYASQTPLSAGARAALEPWLDGAWNPSSLHAEGRRARAAVDDARAQLARNWNVRAREIIFTAGGSESIALALLGHAACVGTGRFLLAPTEHAAVLGCAATLAQQGWTIHLLRIDDRGAPLLDDIRDALAQSDGTPTMLSCMLVNNELGTINPLPEIIALARAHKVFVHCDAVAVGDTVDESAAFAADAVSFAAQKCGGPPGAGILWLRSGGAVLARTPGGPQEAALRAGTENVAAIVGAAKAFMDRRDGRAAAAASMVIAQSAFEQRLRATFPAERFRVTVAGGARSATVSHLLFRDLDPTALLTNLDLAGLAVSAGSACAAGALERSHVLAALDLDVAWSGVVRCSWGAVTTATELDAAGDILRAVVGRMYEVQRGER